MDQTFDINYLHYSTRQFLLILNVKIYNHKVWLRVRKKQQGNWLLAFLFWSLTSRALWGECECGMRCPCIMLFHFWNQSTQSALIRTYCAVISKCIYNGQSSKLCAIFLFFQISTWSFSYYILNWEAFSFTFWAAKHEFFFFFILPCVTCEVCLLLENLILSSP